VDGTIDAAPASPDREDVVETVVSILVAQYGNGARSIVERQITAAEGDARRHWLAIEAALPRA
jgi:hypothetical protein